MQKSGVLNKRQEVSISAIIAGLKRRAKILRWLGAFLIFISLVGLGVVYGPLIEAELTYQFSKTAPTSRLGSALRDMPNWQVPDTSYSLYIPKIAARARVIGNVDASNEDNYLAALKLGVAEAAGLAHPGQIGTTYWFSNSSDGPWNFARYNAVFYLLDRVENGDRVEVMYKDKLLRYKVTKVQILAASDTRYLIPQSREELLVLQTCYPPGTSWNRLVVEARPAY